MQINLGLHLDGQRGWLPSNRLGHQTLGPLGFLITLETQLGLLRDNPSQMTYANAVAEATGKPVLESWLFFPVSAGAVRIVMG